MARNLLSTIQIQMATLSETISLGMFKHTVRRTSIYYAKKLVLKNVCRIDINI